MRDVLEHIDLDFYRSARLLIVHAEIAHLRQQPSACIEQQRKIPLGTSRPVGDFNQLLNPVRRK
jgi:hypothetical protein